MQTLSYKAIRDLFGTSVSRHALLKAERDDRIPKSVRHQRGSISARVWELRDIPTIGEKYGFMKKPKEPMVCTVFASKGGVFKTTLALNLARLAALHNIKTCIVGLDLQCDISRLMGAVPEDDTVEDLERALAVYNQQSGLASLLKSQLSVFDLIQVYEDLPTLQVIPESLGLIHLDMELNSRFRKEVWIKEKVTDPLKTRFDLIILDCPPSWSITIANALVATDVLISPLEVGMSHFANARTFVNFLGAFRDEMRISFDHIFVPTRFNPRRRLSQDICDWYLKNMEGCTRGVIRDSATGFEAIGERLSVPEFAPRSDAGMEMRSLIQEVWERAVDARRQLRVA